MSNTSSRTGLHPRLIEFVDEVRRTQDDGLPRAELVEQVRQALSHLIADAAWLPPDARVGDPERYTQHLLYVAPDRSFSVVALVWDPGQYTPIHDHVTWCVVGVLEGRESQTRYHLGRDHGGPCLVEVGREVAPRGSCSSLVPPEENIHRVTNDSDARAISIHVYGADIEALGTSINQRFDGLPIRQPSGDQLGQRRWRDEHNAATPS